MRPVNLIPPEDRRGDRAPLRAGPLSYVVLAAVLLAFVGVYMMVSAQNSISEKEARVGALEESLALTQARAEALASFGDFASLEDSRTDTVSSLARSRFDWERVLRELSLVIPADVTVSSLNGTVTGDAAAGEGGETSSSGVSGVPSLTIAGCAKSQEVVANLVASLRDIDGVTRVGLSSTSLGEGTGAGAGTTGPAEGSQDCSEGEPRFDITVAFDGVVVDPATGGIVPQEPAAPDDSGVAQAQA